MPRKESRTSGWERREWADRSRYDGRIILCIIIGGAAVGLTLGYAADRGRWWWLVPPLVVVAVVAAIAIVRRDRTIKQQIRRELG